MYGHVGHDGMLRLEVPLDVIDQTVEAVIVVQVVNSAPLPTDAPRDMASLFALLDSMPGDDLVERADQGVRDPIELTSAN